MSHLLEIFKTSNLDVLERGAPFIRIFAQTQWKIHLEILANVYQLFEDTGGYLAPYERVEAVVVEILSRRDGASPVLKKESLLKDFIQEFKVLEEGYGDGGRYVMATDGGRRLLAIAEDLILNRAVFAGLGIDYIKDTLSSLANGDIRMTPAEAIAKLDLEIAERESDKKRIEVDGVEASRFITVTPRAELISRIDREANDCLMALETIKASYRDIRRKHSARHLGGEGKAGDLLRMVTEFDCDIRSSAAYKSFSNAANSMSHVDGLGNGDYKNLDIDAAITQMLQRGVVDLPPSLIHFTKAFGRMAREISRIKSVEIEILNRHILASLNGNTKKLTKDLDLLLHTMSEVGEDSLMWLDNWTVSYNAQTFGGKKMNLKTFNEQAEIPPQAVIIEEEGLGLLGIDARTLASQVNIDAIIARIGDHIRSRGQLVLSDHTVTGGLVELAILLDLKTYIPDIERIGGGAEEKISLEIFSGSDQICTILKVPNYTYVTRPTNHETNKGEA